MFSLRRAPDFSFFTDFQVLSGNYSLNASLTHFFERFMSWITCFCFMCDESGPVHSGRKYLFIVKYKKAVRQKRFLFVEAGEEEKYFKSFSLGHLGAPTQGGCSIKENPVTSSTRWYEEITQQPKTLTNRTPFSIKMDRNPWPTGCPICSIWSPLTKCKGCQEPFCFTLVSYGGYDLSKRITTS